MSSPSPSPPSSPSAKRRKVSTVTTPPPTPKKSASMKAGAWSPEHDAFILASKREGNTNSAIAQAFSAKFGLEKSAEAIKQRLLKLKAKNMEWSEEMEADLKDLVAEHRSQNVYSIIAKMCKSKGGSLGEVKQPAVVIKLKEMERAGVIDKLS